MRWDLAIRMPSAGNQRHVQKNMPSMWLFPNMLLAMFDQKLPTHAVAACYTNFRHWLPTNCETVCHTWYKRRASRCESDR
mmetsp:Transcript_15913/g.45488  ORF Transcript_15913/g.45488 Transcript_15913/m.45488 type:complete len:80 (+) Transcript_15913:49-288(+)